jgi:hypothetical protein
MVAVATIVDYLGGLVLPDTPARPLPEGLARQLGWQRSVGTSTSR